MNKLFAVEEAALVCLGLGACTPDQIKAGASIAVNAATAPACSAVANGSAAAASLCLDSAGVAISIIDFAAQNGIKAHIAGDRLYYDGRIGLKGWSGRKV